MTALDAYIAIRQIFRHAVDTRSAEEIITALLVCLHSLDDILTRQAKQP